MSGDRRQAERTDCQIAATLELESRVLVDCVVRNLSETGANVLVLAAVDLPEEFVLRLPMIPGADQRLRCKTRWRDGGLLGVAFIPEFDATGS